SLILASARWFSSASVARYREEFRDAYEKLARKNGSRAVDFVPYWYEIRPLLLGREKLSAMDSIVEDFHGRWSKILRFSGDERRVQYTTEELRPRVLSAFHTVGQLLSIARYHSPDVMVAASSVEHIRRGDYLLVMGELHVAGNTLGCPLFIEQHQTPQKLRDAFDRDLPETRLVPMIPKLYWDGQAARLLPSAIASNSLRLAFSPEPSTGRGSRTVRIGDMVVDDTSNGLVVRSRDGKLSFDIIETFETGMFSVLNNTFSILGSSEHSPRITIDRLVVCRETWRMVASQLEFAWEKTEPTRFVEARKMARRLGLPRFVFVKSPAEVKPFYVDFD